MFSGKRLKCLAPEQNYREKLSLFPKNFNGKFLLKSSELYVNPGAHDTGESKTY